MGKKNGLNPVLYLDSESNISGILRIASQLVFKGKKIEGDSSEVEDALLEVLRYSKNYEGTLERGGVNPVQDKLKCLYLS